jgi:hypothetical protein
MKFRTYWLMELVSGLCVAHSWNGYGMVTALCCFMTMTFFFLRPKISFVSLLLLKKIVELHRESIWYLLSACMRTCFLPT